jgi:hypothetical protein
VFSAETPKIELEQQPENVKQLDEPMGKESEFTETLASAVDLLSYCVICEEQGTDAAMPRIEVRLFTQLEGCAEQRSNDCFQPSL